MTSDDGVHSDPRSLLRRAARDAPDGPGVYYFVGAAGELLYVGKSNNVRRRLRQHADSPGSGSWVDVRYGRAAAVRWQPFSTESEAAAFEADVIVALRPPFNAAHREEGRWSYLVVEPGRRAGTTRFRLTDARPPARARVYGCFPHLGRGLASRRGAACSDGYAALLRLLWSASAPSDLTVPSRLCATAPPDVEIKVQDAHDRALHTFLFGTSSRLLAQLAVASGERADVAQPALARDRRAALGFYVHGPLALRALRLRHGGRRHPISRELFEAMVRADVEQVLAQS
jgi:predicted GIY-YIG superfamily endonuclease